MKYLCVIQLCVFFHFLFLFCTGSQAEEVSRDELAKRYESYIASYSDKSSNQKLKQAVNFLRQYYVMQNDEKKLEWLRGKIVSTTPVTGDNRNLFNCLMELEDISLKLHNKKADPETISRINQMIKQLHEFRWGKRDLARALSYVAIGKAYYLLGEYEQAIKKSMVDIALFKALDDKYTSINDKASSPLAALIYLHGSCYQAISEQANDSRKKIKYLSNALVVYYKFIVEYPDSNLIQDAVFKYKYCRNKLGGLTGVSLMEIDESRLIPKVKKDRLPRVIRGLIDTGNYSQAIQMLQSEIDSRSNQKVSPIYALSLAECYAYIANGKKVNEIFNIVIKKHSQYPDLPKYILRCAGILVQKNQSSFAAQLYQAFYDNYSTHPQIGVAAFYIAYQRLEQLRKDYSLGKKSEHSKVLKMFDIALSKASDDRQKYYIYEGYAETSFLAQNYLAAAQKYQMAASLSGITHKERKYSTLNQVKALYQAGIEDKKNRFGILTKANEVISKNHLTQWNSHIIPDTITSESHRWSAKIYDKIGDKEKAAQVMQTLIDATPNEASKIRISDMTYTAMLYYQINNYSQASKLLKELASFKSVQINDVRFNIGKKLFEEGKFSEANDNFNMLLKDSNNLDNEKLIWLLENLYDKKGKKAEACCYIAFKAGRLLSTRNEFKKNRKILENIQYKTAKAAITLKNYPTAMAILDTILKNQDSSMWFPAMLLKADVYAEMSNYQASNEILKNVALTATKTGLYSYCIRAKHMIAKNMMGMGMTNKAISIIENLLLPLRQKNKNDKHDLPFIYQEMIFTAAQLAKNRQQKIQYSQLYHKLFPNGKFKNKAILNIRE